MLPLLQCYFLWSPKKNKKFAEPKGNILSLARQLRDMEEC